MLRGVAQPLISIPAKRTRKVCAIWRIPKLHSTGWHWSHARGILYLLFILKRVQNFLGYRKQIHFTKLKWKHICDCSSKLDCCKNGKEKLQEATPLWSRPFRCTVTGMRVHVRACVCVCVCVCILLLSSSSLRAEYQKCQEFSWYPGKPSPCPLPIKWVKPLMRIVRVLAYTLPANRGK